MPIRMARLEDIPALVEGGRRMHALTRFRHFDYLPEKVASNLELIIKRGQGKYVILVAENGMGEIVGALIGVIEKHIFSDLLVANVINYSVLPCARMGGYSARLMIAFQTWAHNRDVAEISVSQNSAMRASDMKGFERLLARLAYVKVGSTYVKECGNGV